MRSTSHEAKSACQPKAGARPWFSECKDSNYFSYRHIFFYVFLCVHGIFSIKPWKSYANGQTELRLLAFALNKQRVFDDLLQLDELCEEQSQSPTPSRAYPDGGCYVNAVVPSLWLRYAFASGSLPSMEHQRTYNGFTTDLRRTYIEGLPEHFSHLYIVFYAE